MSIFYGTNGKQYNLANQPIATGGEGSIYAVATPINQVAKIYHAASSQIERKISIMVSRPPASGVAAQLAWPIDVLRDGSGAFRGFVMNKLDTTHELLQLYKYPPMEFEGITLRHKLIIAQNICAVIDGVHSAGYIFGDFNPMNIGVNLKTGTVAFFDTDSYHIRDPQTNNVFRCNVCLPGYVAPELISACKKYRATHPNDKDVYANMPLPTFSKETDRFALAIHIFKLLMNGYSPFNGIDQTLTVSQASPGVGDVAVERDNYCFKPGLKPQSVATPSLNTLPKPVQDLFQRAFIEGRTSPSRRPSAREWFTVLEQYEQNLCQCSRNKNHLHYKGISQCPWCEAERAYKASIASLARSSSRTKPLPVPPGNTTCTHQNSSAATSARPTVTQPATTWQEPGTFWLVTLVGAAAISGIILYILYSAGALAYGTKGGLEEFADMITPYVLFAGGIIGPIIFNSKFASDHVNQYTGEDYALSLLMSPVGMIAAFIILLLVIAAIYIIVIGVIIAAVFGAFSGG